MHADLQRAEHSDHRCAPAGRWCCCYAAACRPARPPHATGPQHPSLTLLYLPRCTHQHLSTHHPEPCQLSRARPAHPSPTTRLPIGLDFQVSDIIHQPRTHIETSSVHPSQSPIRKSKRRMGVVTRTAG
eukprot:6373918-Prymnesium_polylepis.2